MTEADADRADLAESQRALRDAKRSAVQADVAIASLQQTSAGIASIVEENGYLERFRQVLRGA